MNLNKCFIIGRLTKDPDLRMTKGGTPVATISVASNRVWTDKTGKKNEDTEFHNVVVLGSQAETVNTYLKKGSEVMVEGRLQTRSWDDQKSGVKRYITEVIAERVQFGARPKSDQGTAPAAHATAAPKTEGPEVEEIPYINVDEKDITADDLPF